MYRLKVSFPNFVCIWFPLEEKEVLTSNEKEKKHEAEILKLLKAVQVPLQVAVMYCPGHQKEDAEVARGNNLAEWAAKEVAKGMFIMPLVPVLDLSQFDPGYLTAKGWGFDEEGPDSGWRKNKKGVILLPEHLVEPVMKHLHEAIHYGRDSLNTYVKPWLTGPGVSESIRKVIAGCVVCWKNIPKIDPHQRRERKQYQGQCPLRTGK